MTDVAEIALLDDIDAWLKQRCKRLSTPMSAHILAGHSFDDPEYRVNLGKHQAYMAVRSYIHGTRAHLTQEQPR